jgi:pyruvate/2-oxoglutarate dehydrogenase complex dihydrolipoamide dehydrogenase (E3) component
MRYAPPAARRPLQCAEISSLNTWCTYTDPEIAHVGLYIKEARAKGTPVKTFTVMMHDVDRAVTDGEDEGFIKIHVREGTDKKFSAPRWLPVTQAK